MQFSVGRFQSIEFPPGTELDLAEYLERQPRAFFTIFYYFIFRTNKTFVTSCAAVLLPRRTSHNALRRGVLDRNVARFWSSRPIRSQSPMLWER
jgi:hypothetical protein